MAPSRLRHRVPIGLILQKQGVVTGTQLQEALRLQEATGQRLGDVLQDYFGVPEERITAAIAAQWGLPVVHLPMPSAGLPRETAAPAQAHAAGVFPVERTASSVLLACAEGPDPGLALGLERMHPLRVDFGVVGSATLERWRALHAEGAIPVQHVRRADRGSLAAEAADMLFRLQPVESRMVRVGGVWWLRMWLEDAAREQDGAAGLVDTVDVLYSLEADGSISPRSNA